MDDETGGAFGESYHRYLFFGHGSCLNSRTIVRFIAGLDIFYAMLLIGLHLLTLITGGGSRVKRFYTEFSTKYPNNVGNFSNNINTTEVLPGPETQHSLEKSRETLAVMIWVGMFAVCILQLLVAGALYGGTKQREGRICLRNCRIWAYTSTFLIILIIFQILGICIKATIKDHIFLVTVYGVEVLCRLFGLLAVYRLRKDIRDEQCDLDNDEHVLYYELQQTTPSPVHKPVPQPMVHNRRHYHRAEVFDELDLEEL